MRVLRVGDGELAATILAAANEPADTHTVVVTEADGAPVDADVAGALTSLPCIVIGLGHDPNAPPAHVDLVLEPEVCDVDDVVATVEANPLAATALVLLLRAGPYRSLDAGLVAESAVYSMLQGGPEFATWRARNPRRVRPPDGASPVRVERVDSTLYVVLNRPHVRNALDRAMRDQLLDAFAVAADPSIESVDVRGEGPVFCSGGDLDEFGTFDDPASAHLVRLATSIGRAIASVAGRVTFRMHGACAGSGIELPAFAANVVADPATTFALPEVGLGLVPGAGGTVSLTRRAGRHRVALLALCGRAIDTGTARRWGLVDAVEPRTETDRWSP